MSFIYLNNKSGYSFLKSTLKIDDLVRIAKEKELPFLALTDENSMFGAMEFVHACKKNSIKPIIGMEVKLDIEEIPLVLIATCNEGYINLCKLTKFVSTQKIDNFVKYEQLDQYKNGIVCILPYIRGFMHDRNNEEKFALVKKLKEIFTGFYIGLECYGNNDFSKLDDARYFAKSNSLLTVPLLEVLCENAQSTYLIDVLRAIDANMPVDKLLSINHENHHFISEISLKQIFTEDEILSSYKLGSICEIDFSKIKGDLVEFPINIEASKEEYLRALSFKGLEKRLNGKVTQKYIDRLNYELEIIHKMNYDNYFLVVYDYIRFAKKNDILVGPGRGSSGSCLVAYTLGITNVDPLKYNLVFERFLNPERVSMPDIDADFIDSKRELVFNYLINKYGEERTCRVISFSTLTAKACLRDVSKALGCSLAEQNELSRVLGTVDKDDTLATSVAKNPSFLSLIKTNEKYNKVYRTALLVENLPRQSSTHAAGLVINCSDVTDVIPIYKSNNNYISTQFSKDYLEEFNLYKMDILGLTNLSIFEECIKLIKSQQNISVDFYNIDVEDPNIYKVFLKRQFAGIFQFDANSISHASTLIKPTCLNDLVAILALGRPGPNKFVPTFANCKRGLKRPSYLHPSLEPILKETYGIITYQEQIMQILTKMASFSLGKADLVRRAISKKNAEKLAIMREEFISGCIKNKYSKEEANNVFDNIMLFADYGFCKSHSVEYAYVSAISAYFKYYYPAIFYTSLFNVTFNKDKLLAHYHEMKANGIKLLSPNINLSTNVFKALSNAVLYPLNKIEDITPQTVSIIINERDNNGLYDSFTDFVKRTNILGLEEKDYIALIEAGCFDEFKVNRTTLKNNLSTVMMYASIVSKKEDDKVVYSSLVAEPNIREYKDTNSIVAEEEKNRIGLYLTTFPLLKDREKIKEAGFKTIEELKENTTERLVVKIKQVKTLTTKTKEKMAFVYAEDETGIISLVIFPEKYNIYESLLVKDTYVQIKGQVEEKDSELQIIVSMMKSYKLVEEN